MQKIFIPALAVLIVAASPAAAEPASVTVSYADLNLRTSAGKMVLDRRIAQAVRAVCGDVPAADLVAAHEARVCAAAAHADAITKVGVAVARASDVRIAAR